jgi:hypothetical protein
MPWTKDNVEKHKKGLTDKQKETWVKVANSARNRCMEKGGSEKECDASAIRQANKAAGDMKEYRAYTMSTNNVLLPVNAIDVDGEPIPVAELVAAYQEQRGQGQGQGGPRQGDGGADMCVCPDCGREFPHKKGTPCNERECPDCGVALTGKASELGEQYKPPPGWNDPQSWLSAKKGAEAVRNAAWRGMGGSATSCIRHMEGRVDDAGAFCAALKDAVEGKAWRRKKRSKESFAEVIRKEGSTIVLYDSKGEKILGQFPFGEGEKYASEETAREAALRQERAIHAHESIIQDAGKLQELLRQALEILDIDEVAEVDLAESAAGHAIGLAEGAKADTGARAPLMMEVALIKPGFGNKKDNHYYPADVLKRDIHVFEGVKMYATDHRQDEKNVRTEVAVLKACPSRFLDDGTPVALAAVHDGGFAEATRNRAKLGTLDSLECSILGSGRTQRGKIGDKEANIVEAITKGQSVDWVTRAGAGGHALNLAENDAGGVSMEKEKVVRLLSESELPQESQERLAGEEYKDEGAVKEAILQEKARLEAPQQLGEADISKLLAETNLPSASKKRLAGGQYEDESALREAVLAEIDYVKALTGSGQPFGQGSSQAQAQQKLLEERLSEIDLRYGIAQATQEVQNA